MCDPPVALARLGVAQGCGCDGGGGTGHREPAGVTRSGVYRVYGLPKPAQKGGQRGCGGSPGLVLEQGVVQGARRRRPAVEAGGVRGIWGGVAAEVPRLLDPVEEMRRRAAEVQRWSGKPESHRRREIVAAAELTCGETWSNSGEGAARTGASGLRVNPGLRADLWWGSAGRCGRGSAGVRCGRARRGGAERRGGGG